MLTLAAFVAFVAVPVGMAWANAFAPSKAFELAGQGGVTFQIPPWAEKRTAPDVAVFEHDARAKGGDDFYLLMLTVEAGPTGTGKVDWEAIRKNVMVEAAKNKAQVVLEAKEDFKGAAGFAGKRMAGTITSKGQIMSVELLALVQKGKLVTVTVVSGKAGANSQKLAADVAKTAKLK